MSLSLKNVVFSLFTRFHNSDSRSYSWSCLKVGRFFSSSGFSLVPPALQLILLFFHRWRLSFHTGDRLSGSKSHLSFLAFLKQLLFPALVLKYKRLADDSLTLFRKYLIWGLWGKKKKVKKKKRGLQRVWTPPPFTVLGDFTIFPVLISHPPPGSVPYMDSFHLCADASCSGTSVFLSPVPPKLPVFLCWICWLLYKLLTLRDSRKVMNLLFPGLFL